MKDYCTQNKGDCQTCSLSNYGRDCQNNKIEDSEPLLTISMRQLCKLNKLSQLKQLRKSINQVINKQINFMRNTGQLKEDE